MIGATRLERMQQWLAGKLPADVPLPVQFPPTLNKTLGIELVAIEQGSCSMSMVTDPARHANPMGTIHGGVLCDLGDAAIGVSHSASLQDDESFTSVDLRINFFRPVWEDTLLAVAKVKHRGRTVSYYTCDITNSEHKLVATLTSTVMTLRGDQARGR